MNIAKDTVNNGFFLHFDLDNIKEADTTFNVIRAWLKNIVISFVRVCRPH